MRFHPLIRHSAKRAYKTTRVGVWLLFAVVMLLVAAFLFLRVYGVPKPLLREALRRANSAGIPLEVDNVVLTIRGWRAENVRYYSSCPDDLEPLFHAPRVLFSIDRRKEGPGGSRAWMIDTDARSVRVNPSIMWGINIPVDSPARNVEHLKVSLEFHSDRIVLGRAAMEWLGLRFNVAGTVSNGVLFTAAPATRKLWSAEHMLLSRERYAQIVRQLERLELPDGASIDARFAIDAQEVSRSTLSIHARVQEFSFDAVDFSAAALEADYSYPTARIVRLELFQGAESVRLGGEMDVATRVIKCSLGNTLTSNRLLRLLPQETLDLLEKYGVWVDFLPVFQLQAGSAAWQDLPKAISGNFMLRSGGYEGARVDSLRGKVAQRNGRLEFYDLHGLLSADLRHCDPSAAGLRGGAAGGSVFWDSGTRTFGVDTESSFDPNLLVQALSSVEEATNVIRRFSFNGRPPDVKLSLGACVDDWNTFHMRLGLEGRDFRFQGAVLSNTTATAVYTGGVLRLDPIAVVQGNEWARGRATVDFRTELADFDIEGTMQPAVLEDLIVPDLEVFGKHIQTAGEVHLDASGRMDWGSMRQTDFKCRLQAEKLTTPVAETSGFSADIEGEGPLISVTNAQFSLCGGSGRGSFSLRYEPVSEHLPYHLDVDCSNVDFKQYLGYVFPSDFKNVSGTLSGNIHCTADMKTNFLAAADGGGAVAVEKGQLADLPFFSGFSKVVRVVFPGFNVFSITSLRGTYRFQDGALHSDDAYFGGDVICASGRGSYTEQNGFDAYVQVQILGDVKIASILRIVTDPLFKLLEIKLDGPLGNPSWRLDKFPKEISNLFNWRGR